MHKADAWTEVDEMHCVWGGEGYVEPGEVGQMSTLRQKHNLLKLLVYLKPCSSNLVCYIQDSSEVTEFQGGTLVGHHRWLALFGTSAVSQANVHSPAGDIGDELVRCDWGRHFHTPQMTFSCLFV